jgi:endonuclease/exonuclease/phosphatase (EEP) superfamily protein YafD
MVGLKRLLRVCLAIAIALLFALLAAGYLGAFHPAGDSFAVFRPQIANAAAIVAIAAFSLGQGWPAAALAVAAGIGGLPIALAATQSPEVGQGIRLYQKNMLFMNDDLAALQSDIRAANPAILTLQEVSGQNRHLLAVMTDILPHQMRCPFAAVGGTAIATSLPPTPAAQICAPGLAAMQVIGPDGPLWIVSVHLHWPWPFRQATQVDALIPVLEGLAEPMVIAGDFNMVPWSHTLGRWTKATHTQIAAPILGTYAGFAPIMLPIDHVLGPAGTTVTQRPLAGADHHGLLAILP